MDCAHRCAQPVMGGAHKEHACAHTQPAPDSNVRQRKKQWKTAETKPLTHTHKHTRTHTQPGTNSVSENPDTAHTCAHTHIQYPAARSAPAARSNGKQQKAMETPPHAHT